MGVLNILNDPRFNIFFSFVLGLGIICMLKPICSGSECSIEKAPAEKDFDKYIYRMNGGTCYEFKSEIVECPSSGTIEGFRECPAAKSDKAELFINDNFSRRYSPIKRCE
jgi:hypothetical protein